MNDYDPSHGGPHFDRDLFSPGPRRLHKGGGKPRGPTAAQIELEKAQLELSRRQLAEMEAEANKPTPEAPPPLAPMSPVAFQSTADMEQAAMEERRRALKRTAPARSTIFAGESGHTSLGGTRTLLG